jgi:ribose-phosphate pyrophosphokinase
VDDMVDTAGTLCKAVDVLLEQGARRVFAFCSHGVLSGPAATRIAKSNLTELVILDTIPLSKECEVRVPVKSVSSACAIKTRTMCDPR